MYSLRNLIKSLAILDIFSDPKEYVRNILHLVCDNLAYSFGSVIEIDEHGKGYVFTTYNLPADYPQIIGRVKAPVLSSPSGEAISTGEIVVVKDTWAEPRLVPWAEMLKAYQLKMIVWVPMKNKGKSFGVYALYNSDVHDVSEEELQALEQVSVMISLAIASNQYLDKLHEQTKLLQREVRRLAEIALQEHRDLLELKVAERTAELQQAQNFLRSVMDNIPDSIFVKDKEFRYILANTYLASVFKTTVEQVIGRDDLELGLTKEQVFGDPERDIPGLRIDDHAVLVGQHIYRQDSRIALVDNSTRVFDMRKMPIRDETGDIVGVLGISHDVTERLAMEEEQERLRQQVLAAQE